MSSSFHRLGFRIVPSCLTFLFRTRIFEARINAIRSDADVQPSPQILGRRKIISNGLLCQRKRSVEQLLSQKTTINIFTFRNTKKNKKCSKRRLFQRGFCIETSFLCDRIEIGKIEFQIDSGLFHDLGAFGIVRFS